MKILIRLTTETISLLWRGVMSLDTTTHVEGLALDLIWLDLYLRLAILEKFRLAPNDGNHAFGTAISAGEMNQYLGISSDDDPVLQIEASLYELERMTPPPGAKRTYHADQAHLMRVFQLNDMDWRILVACLAPALNHKYRRLYGYLGNDIGLLWPDTALLLHVLARTHEQNLRISAFIHGHPALTQFKLIEITSDGQLKPNPRLIAWLSGDKEADLGLSGQLKLLPTNVATAHPKLPDGVETAVLQIVDSLKYHPKPLPPYRVLLRGEAGSGRRDAAGRICGGTGLALFEMQLPPTVADAHKEPSANLLLELLLAGAVPLVDCEEQPIEATQRKSREDMLDMLNRIFPLVFVLRDVTQAVSLQSFGLPELKMLPIDFALPDFSARCEAWRHALKSIGFNLKNLQPESLAAMYRFTRGRIFQAARVAHTLRIRNPDLCHDDLVLEAARGICNRHLGEMAEHVPTCLTLDQLILCPESKQHLNDLVSFFKNRDRLFDDWDFGKRVSQRGLHALFFGPPGTGKTMAAGIIANQLKLEMYRIDLSQIISKYIGETEKNLAAIFREARTANVVLFFDEADALFGKRSEVNDAHDRFANVETSYLLQEMETYDGVTILATNFLNNLDEAFTRRIKAIIEFPFPEADERVALWRGMFPAKTPLRDDVDFGFISSQFRLSGGEIKNIALSAASYAMETNDPVGMAQLLWAIRLEQSKKGRIFIPSDYGKYAELAAEHPVRSFPSTE